MNNFQKLAEEELKVHGAPPSKVKRKIDDSMSLYRLIGNVIELFVPRVLGVFSNMFGGDHQEEEGPNTTTGQRYPNKPQ